MNSYYLKKNTIIVSNENNYSITAELKLNIIVNLNLKDDLNYYVEIKKYICNTKNLIKQNNFQYNKNAYNKIKDLTDYDYKNFIEEFSLKYSKIIKYKSCLYISIHKTNESTKINLNYETENYKYILYELNSLILNNIYSILGNKEVSDLDVWKLNNINLNYMELNIRLLDNNSNLGDFVNEYNNNNKNYKCFIDIKLLNNFKTLNKIKVQNLTFYLNYVIYFLEQESIAMYQSDFKFKENYYNLISEYIRYNKYKKSYDIHKISSNKEINSLKEYNIYNKNFILKYLLQNKKLLFILKEENEYHFYFNEIRKKILNLYFETDINNFNIVLYNVSSNSINNFTENSENLINNDINGEYNCIVIKDLFKTIKECEFLINIDKCFCKLLINK